MFEFELNHKRWMESGLGPTTDDMYDCRKCLANGTEHKIIRVPGPPAEGSHTHCIKGEPTTKRRCTGCGIEDGPWVPA